MKNQATMSLHFKNDEMRERANYAHLRAPPATKSFGVAANNSSYSLQFFDFSKHYSYDYH